VLAAQRDCAGGQRNALAQALYDRAPSSHSSHPPKPGGSNAPPAPSKWQKRADGVDPPPGVVSAPSRPGNARNAPNIIECAARSLQIAAAEGTGGVKARRNVGAPRAPRTAGTMRSLPLRTSHGGARRYEGWQTTRACFFRPKVFRRLPFTAARLQGGLPSRVACVISRSTPLTHQARA
jgi:hypothetical protein